MSVAGLRTNVGLIALTIDNSEKILLHSSTLRTVQLVSSSWMTSLMTVAYFFSLTWQKKHFTITKWSPSLRENSAHVTWLLTSYDVTPRPSPVFQPYRCHDLYFNQEEEESCYQLVPVTNLDAQLIERSLVIIHHFKEQEKKRAPPLPLPSRYIIFHA